MPAVAELDGLVDDDEDGLVELGDELDDAELLLDDPILAFVSMNSLPLLRLDDVVPLVAVPDVPVAPPDGPCKHPVSVTVELLPLRLVCELLVV